MGIVNYTYNRSTSGGEIITHLINSTDGQGLNFANGALLQLAYAAGGVFGTGDFSIEFIIDQSSANSNDKILYTSQGSGSNTLQLTSQTGSANIEISFDSTDYDLPYDMSADYGSPVHYVLTFDRSALATLYKDGNSVATVNISGSSSVDLGSGNTNVGYLGGVSDYGVTGVFYRWRTWKKLLSAAEVTACYENASVPIADQWTNCVTDLDFAFANPEMSLQIQSRSGIGDATASAGVSQITPIDQLNTNKLSVGGTTPLVGIGLAAGVTPAEQLHVSGDVRIDTDLYIQPTKKFYVDGGNDTYITEVAANAIGFNTAGVERMRIDSTGSVEVRGNSATAYDPAAAQDSDGTTLSVWNTNETANTYAAIQLAQKVGGSWGKVRIVCSGASNQGELGFQVENAGTYSEAMRIDGTGNTLMKSATGPVLTSERDSGSGTTGASGALYLRNKTTGVMANGFGAEMQFRVTDADNTNVPLAAINATRQTNDTSGQLVFRTYKTGSGVDRLTIDEDGNAGLNTSAPNESGFSGDCRVLSVQGAAADGFGVLELITPDVTSLNRLGEIRFVNLDGSASTPAAYAGIRATRDGADDATSLSLWTGTGGSFAERFTISGSGAVTTDGNAGAGYHAVKDNGTLSGYFGSGLGLAASPNNANTDLVNRAVGKLVFCTDNSNVAKMVIDTAGLASFSPATNTAGINVTTAGDPAYGVKIDSAGAGITNPSLWVYNNGASSGPLAFLEQDHTSGTNDVLKIQNDGSGRSIYVEGGGIVEKDGVLKENLLTNSGFDVWSNSTLEDVGSEEVDNGGFGSDASDWAISGGAVTWVSTGGESGGYASTTSGWLYQQLSGLTPHALYKLTAYVKEGSSAGEAAALWVDDTSYGQSDQGKVEFVATDEWVAHSVVFEPVSSNPFITLQFPGYNGTKTIFWDSVSVKEVTPGEIVSGIFTCDGWSKDGAAAHGKSYRQHEHATFTKDGSFYSLKFISHATSDNCLYQVPFSNVSNSTTMSSPEVLARVAGRTMTFGAWVYSASGAADDVAVYISDSERGYSTSQHDVSAFHSASTGWEWLEVTHTFGASPAAATVGFFFDAGTTTSYMSQPMLVFGSAIGEGNYTRPSGEIVWFEKQVDSNKYEALTGQSDEAMTTLNLEADSNGAIPKGAKSVMLYTFIKDSGSASSDAYLRTRVDSTAGNFYVNDATGKANDAQSRLGGWQSCDSSGDIQVQMEATGSGTLDIDGFEYKGVQLR